MLPVQRPLPRYWFSVMKEESFVALGRAAQPIITLPHLCADSLQTLARLVQGYRQGYFAAGGDASQDANQYEIPLIFYTCVAPTRIEAQQQGERRYYKYLAHQHHGADVSQTQHKVRQLEERNQLWFGTPPDLIQWIEQHQAALDNRHFVFWLDFGGMPLASVYGSMHLLAEEVMPHFIGQAG